MPTNATKGSKPIKKNIVPKPKESIREPPEDVLADFIQWVEQTKLAAKSKQKSLNDSGRDDIATHKIIIRKLLIERFRDSKWT